MYTVEITTEFAAAHALVIAGRREPVHGHNWHVTALISGPSLDGDGLLCDFHTVHAVLEDIVAPFHNNDLNATAPFDERNPTAELIARHIADELADRLGGALAEAARVESVRVTESPGCAAIYRP
ncbi:MAG: 6-carboxytetrahydropterin synthase [Phycisphaerales bacterium]|nr:6-carboxytetrahydropterin synthase [Planctomycetota bacterium]MCH8509671.1 6-carboxytetrahydropterin synthase [Phycisphaerales bacterium]